MFVFWRYRTRIIQELLISFLLTNLNQQALPIYIYHTCASSLLYHRQYDDLHKIVSNSGHCWLVTIIYISNLTMIYVSNCCSIHTLYITLLMHTWDCGFKPDVSEQTVSQENKVQSSIRLNINARTSLIQR